MRIPIQAARPTLKPRTTGRERAAVTPLIAAALVVAALTAGGIARIGGAVLHRARADAVADLVALGGVTGGPSGARAVASADGAELLALYVRGDTTVVEVRVSGVRSVAAARPLSASALPTHRPLQGVGIGSPP